jgi:hypothetical protein
MKLAPGYKQLVQRLRHLGAEIGFLSILHTSTRPEGRTAFAVTSVTSRNATSEPLSSRELGRRLITTEKRTGMRSSKRRKMADEDRDWYSWLLPSLCLILLAALLLNPVI